MNLEQLAESFGSFVDSVKERRLSVHKPRSLELLDTAEERIEQLSSLAGHTAMPEELFNSKVPAQAVIETIKDKPVYEPEVTVEPELAPVIEMDPLKVQAQLLVQARRDVEAA